jgi:hypothetical protein
MNSFVFTRFLRSPQLTYPGLADVDRARPQTLNEFYVYDYEPFFRS